MREKQREETRKRLYLASLEVFKRDGVQNCRIDDIARIAEVSRAAFYFHFPTKDAVLLQLFAEMDEAVAQGFETLAPDVTALALLENMNASLVSFWRDRRELIADTYGAVLRTISQVRDPEQFPSLTRFAQGIKRLQDKGQWIKDFPAEVFAQSFLNASMIAIISWVSTPEVPLDALMKRGAYIFHRAVRPD